MYEPPSNLDLEHCTVPEGYARWAATYDAMLTDTVDGPILRQLLPSCSLPPMTRILDYGCGTGRNMAWLKEYGISFSAIGVDISTEMLDQARPKGLYDEVMSPSQVPDGASFDLCTCILVSCHVADLESLYGYMAGRLKQGGYLLLIDMHPHMFYIGKGTYVPIGNKKVYIENHVHDIADYLNTGIIRGFQLVGSAESYVPSEWAARSANYNDAVNEPLGIGFLWKKQDSQQGGQPAAFGAGYL